MIITEVHAEADWVLRVVSEDGRRGRFDAKPYLADEALEALRDPREFAKVSTGGYFVEWDCGADLSADTIEAKWQAEARTPRDGSTGRARRGTLLRSGLR